MFVSDFIYYILRITNSITRIWEIILKLSLVLKIPNKWFVLPWPFQQAASSFNIKIIRRPLSDLRLLEIEGSVRQRCKRSLFSYKNYKRDPLTLFWSRITPVYGYSFQFPKNSKFPKCVISFEQMMLSYFFLQETKFVSSGWRLPLLERCLLLFKN